MEECLLNLGSGLTGGSDLFLAAGASVARAFLAAWNCCFARTCPAGPSAVHLAYASCSFLAAAKLLKTSGVRPRFRASVSASRLPSCSLTRCRLAAAFSTFASSIICAESGSSPSAS